MPITKDKFDRIGDEEVQSDSSANRVLDFLIQNENKAYTQSEIAEETNLNPKQIGSILSKLTERGSAEHKSGYWCVSDHELAVRCGTALTAETARQHDDGDSFDVEKWAKHAVDETARAGENE